MHSENYYILQGLISTLRHLINTSWLFPGSPRITACSPVYLMSLWWFAWAGGGGTKEPVTTQGAPEAGSEVGLMYSFSSQSDDGFSPLGTADADRDLTIHGQHKAWWDCLNFFICGLQIRFSHFWEIWGYKNMNKMSVEADDPQHFREKYGTFLLHHIYLTIIVTL